MSLLKEHKLLNFSEKHLTRVSLYIQVAYIPPYNHTRSIYRNYWLTTVLSTMKFKYHLFSTCKKISLLLYVSSIFNMHTRARARTNTRARTHTHTHTHTHTYLRTYIHIYTRVRNYIQTSIHARTYIHLHKHIRTCTHIHKYIYTDKSYINFYF